MDECPVCFEGKADGERIWCTLPCTHVVCLTCLSKLGRAASGARCPLCRRDLAALLPTIDPTPVTTRTLVSILRDADDRGEEQAFEDMIRRLQFSATAHAAIQAAPLRIVGTRRREPGEEMTDE